MSGVDLAQRERRGGMALDTPEAIVGDPAPVIAEEQATSLACSAAPQARSTRSYSSSLRLGSLNCCSRR